MKLKNKTTYIIAEIGINHNGKLDIAKKMILESKKAGANAVKFQSYISEDIVAKDTLSAEYQNKNLKKKSIILCTGGAISFFTGDQAPINNFIDKFYLGWLVRLIYNPLIFIKRYIYALKLIPMVFLNKIKIKK